MAIGVLVLGKPGTGKSYSMKSFSPDEVKILSVHKPILPFRGKYEIVKTPTGREIIKEMKNTTKKNIVVDDFQYILGLPMMKRVSEKGWDKFNEIQQPYADVLEAVNNLPDDVIVYFTSHTDTDNDGNTKIKTIGNALDRYIAVEGLFMIVLGTTVINDHYYFVTQNSGNDTLKSPDEMFPSKWIPNDLKYVEDKIRNYYYMDGAKSDEEIAAIDAEHTVSQDQVEPKRKPRGSAKAEVQAEQPKAVGENTESEKVEEAPKARTGRSRKTHDEVVAENNQKIAEHMAAVDEAIDKIADGREEIPFEEAAQAMDSVPQPELETPPRRTRKERVTKAANTTLTEDTCFFIPETNNYVKKHKGDVAPEGGQVISEEEFGKGVVAIAKEGAADSANKVEGAMNPPEEAPATTGRRRRTR